MKIIKTTILLPLIFLASNLHAQSQTKSASSDLKVNAIAMSGCGFQATDVNFGNFDTRNELRTVQHFSLICSKGVTYALSSLASGKGKVTVGNYTASHGFMYHEEDRTQVLYYQMFNPWIGASGAWDDDMDVLTQQKISVATGEIEEFSLEYRITAPQLLIPGNYSGTQQFTFTF